MDAELADRLRAAGVDPADPGDPAAAWQRLHDREGLRATRLDRYTLEAHRRGIEIDQLDAPVRARLTREVLTAHQPGFEVIGGSDRHVRDPIEVVDPDPSWPRHFAAWRDRLANELGPVAVRIEHVGSTSVPGLAAKPVIDIQVSVPDIDDERAYVPGIERCGIAFRSRDDEHRYFRPTGDLPRDVQVHACGAGSTWEARHLLFRDFLRADAETRAAYAALKRRLAERHRDDRIAYNEAKTSFILDAMERAAAWDAAGRPAAEIVGPAPRDG